MNKTKAVGITLSAALAAGALLWMAISKQNVVRQHRPTVAVSTYTLYEAARSVAGETLDVWPVIPFGTDAHMFSPDPSQIAKVSQSSLFVYNGAGFETWAYSLTANLAKGTPVIDMSTKVSLIRENSQSDHDHSEETDMHGGIDPHYWLDIDNMIRMTRTFETELCTRFPEHEKLYHANANAYIEQLQHLKTEYAEGLSECHNRLLVSNHDAFGYLAHANSLTPISVIGLSSDEQPSAKNIANIVTLVKEHGIKTVFFEEFINDNVSQMIARETGAEAKSLQPLENISQEEFDAHHTYVSIMRENLVKLRESMQCR